MFERWGRWIYRWRKATLVVSALFLVLAAVVLAGGGRLTTGTVHGIEATAAVDLIERELRPAEAQGFTVIFEHPTLTVDDDAFREAVQAALAPLRHLPDVRSVRSPFDADTSMFLSATMLSVDAHHCVAEVGLTPAAIADTRRFPAIRNAIPQGPLKATATGLAVYRNNLDQVLQSDLIRAEGFSMPVSILVLLLVFGSLVAALLPVGIGALAVVGGIGCLLLLSRRLEVAQYAINVGSLVGTGVAIDYSLFVVNRFREELAGGLSVPDALARAVATAGRAVAFSGVAVAVGLSGLLFFRGSYVASLGLGGTVVVLLAVVFALTFLPALLGVLGHNVNRGRVFTSLQVDTERWWHKVASGVMRHPVLVLVPILALLLAGGRPFLDLKMSVPTIAMLPAHTEARRGLALLTEHFPERAATRITVVARFPGDPVGTPARIGALYDLSRSLAQIPNVERVEGIFDVDPTLDRDGIVAALGGPRDQWSEPLQVVGAQTVGSTVVVMSALTDASPTSDVARDIARRARRQRRVADGEVLVTGAAAVDIDTTVFMGERAPAAIAYVVLMTLLILFVLLGSVVLPLKAVVMNALSICCSFGALVWIFQKGHLSHLLRFTPGPIEPSLPILMFCMVFGLSMDYEVLLLTRIQEEYARTHDNAHSVAEGLARSARLITSAAAIMVVVFSAFALAELVILKAIGLGMAIAVALDATLVRILIVPATMRLFGDLNWWAPAPVARFWRRFFAHEH